jgi:hypothetical protein
MSRILGIAVGLIWLVFVFIAFRNSAAGWAIGASDIGFWWGVIGTLLMIASGGAVVGTWIHTRKAR